MSLYLQAELVFSLLVAALLSALIGLDRERRQRPAGIRTHMLVGLGACLFTLLSYHAFPGDAPGRIAANIVTGVGFLGAGAIIKGDMRVHDLTTAANIWMAAAVGMAVGTGAWFLALAASVIVWIILTIIRRLEPEKLES
jgi:putative Mg2+ transporter-C (MgtC) family protein